MSKSKRLKELVDKYSVLSGKELNAEEVAEMIGLFIDGMDYYRKQVVDLTKEIQEDSVRHVVVWSDEGEIFFSVMPSEEGSLKFFDAIGDIPKVLFEVGEDIEPLNANLLGDEVEWAKFIVESLNTKIEDLGLVFDLNDDRTEDEENSQ